jgi:hypothetical protein
MDFNKLCGMFLFVLFFIDCTLAARYGFLPFLAFIAGVVLVLAWHWYFATTKPSQQLQRIKFGNQYILVEVA